MKKLIAALAVVVVLLLVVAPWGIGRLAEQRVNAGLDQLVKQAPYLTIVERKWGSGWFRSQQEVTFELVGPWTEILKEAAHKQSTSTEASNEPAILKVADETPPVDAPVAPAAVPSEALRFTVRNEILHGPVLWPAGFGIARINTHVVMSEQIRKELVEIFGTDEPLHISTRVAFLGGGTTTFSVDGRSIESKDKSRVKYDDLRIDIGYSQHLDDIDVNGKCAHVDFSDLHTGESVAIDGMAMQGRAKRIRGDLYDKDSSITLDKFRFVGTDKTETEIDGMHYIVVSTSKDDFLDYGIKLGSAKVRNKMLADLKLDLDEVHYDFTLRHLHAETLEKLMAALKQSYTQPTTTAADMSSAIIGSYKQYGIELLQHDPELMVDNLGVVTHDGVGVIKGVIRLKGVTAQDFEGGVTGLIPRIEADLTIDVAQKLIEKIPNGATSAGMALDQGYAKRDGDRVTSRIEFNHGELKINGKAEAIPGMGNPGAAPPPDTSKSAKIITPPPGAQAEPVKPARPGAKHKAE